MQPVAAAARQHTPRIKYVVAASCTQVESPLWIPGVALDVVDYFAPCADAGSVGAGGGECRLLVDLCADAFSLISSAG